MNKYFISFVNKCNLIHLNKKLHYVPFKLNSTDSNQTKNDLNKLNNESVAESDSFGVGSKYAESDSKYNHRFNDQQRSNLKVSLKTFESKKNVKINKEKIDDSDNFGTLNNQLDDISFKTSISYSKPLADSKFLSEEDLDFEEDEDEKKYDKVLNYIRLSNGADRPNNENFYVNKMEVLAEQGKIRDAIDVFYLEMIEKDRYKPTLYLYKTLMKILARAGYTHMVFEVFKRLTGSHDDDWTNQNVKNQKQLHQVITLLFLACSKSQWPEYSIRKTNSIRTYLKNRQIIPNEKNYSAMISAYGKAGAIYESFNVVDEMILNGIKPDRSTFNNLLCSCISQPNYGFKYSLMTWSMCLKYKVRPDLKMYNLMLKAANDCNTNKENIKVIKSYFKEAKKHKKLTNENINLFPVDSKESKEFLDQVYQDLESSTNKSDSDSRSKNIENQNVKISDLNKKLQNKSTIDSLYPEVTHIDSNSDSQIIKLKPDDVHIIEELKIMGESLHKQIKDLEWWQDIKSNVDNTELIKSLADFNPSLRKLILSKNHESVLTKVNMDVEKDILAHMSPYQDTRNGRFELIGGLNILDAMKYHKVKPDFKTFNMMIQLIPNNIKAEDELIQKMKQENIKYDIDFLNCLIYRRYKRKDYDNAKLAFKLIQEHQLIPNIITIGSLALGVYNTKLLVDFINDIKKMNFKLNNQIISTLYYKGHKKLSRNYLKYLFDIIIEEKIPVDNIFIKRVNNDLNKIKKSIIDFERKNRALLNDDEINEYERLVKFYNDFKPYTDKWLTKVKLESKEHPYKKFSRQTDDKYYQEFVKLTENFKSIDEFKNDNNH